MKATAYPQLKKFCRPLLDLLLPQHCWLCSQPSQSQLCGFCSESLPALVSACRHCAIPLSDNSSACASCIAKPPSFDDCLCAFKYEGAVSQLMLAFKQKGQLAAAQPLVQQLRNRLHELPQQDHPSALFVVPSHWRKRMHRGFNPAEFIANELSKSLGIPLLHGLIRAQGLPEQKTLSRKERIASMDRKFKLIAKKRDLPSHIAIVDDVVTTGATTAYIAQLLKSLGVQRVSVWALARTP